MKGRSLAWPLLCALVLALPWEKSVTLDGVGTLARLIGIAALAAAIVEACWRRSVRAPNLALLAAAAFALWCALTWLWSIAPAETLPRALTFLQLLAMLWLVWELARTRRRQLTLIEAYVAGAAVASVLTILRFAAGRQTYYRRYAAAGFDPNDLGLTVALAIPLALYLSLKGSGPVQWGGRLAAALAVAAVLLSASRTAWVVSLVAFLFLFWAWREGGLAHRVSGVVLLGMLVLGPVRLGPPASRERLAALPAELAAGGVHNRTQIWKAGLKAFRRHPVAGVGVGSYPEAVRPRLGAPALEGHRYVAHNTYLSILVESGLVGFGLFALSAAILAAFVWVLPGVERALWATALAMLAVGVTTLSWEHRKPVWLFAGLIMTEWALSFRPEEEPR